MRRGCVHRRLLSLRAAVSVAGMHFRLSPCDLLRLRECPHTRRQWMRDGAGYRVPGHSPLEVELGLMRGRSPWKGMSLVAHPMVVASHVLCQENLSQALLDGANLRSGSREVVEWFSG